MEYPLQITYHQIRHMISHRWRARTILNLRRDAHVDELTSGDHSKTFESGWTIHGCNSYEFARFCHQFMAEHPVHGKILGSLRNSDRDADKELDFVVMKANHYRAFQHFWEHHGLFIEGTKDTINYPDTDSEDDSESE